uniref:Uncharacterized protein n=1 Tax=Eutreptiella gymnastica TaxID=73025 RepID=A0A7S4FR63_9EUGL
MPASLFELSALQELSGENNALVGFGTEDTAGGLKQLKKLVLNHNSISALPDSLFSRTELNKLEIEHNPLAWDELKKLPSYDQWRERQRINIDKQMQGGLVVELNK